ncbi:unnamed protein product [Citrullus colocynthis]|uniref:Uncharacterized protein n=1 Tax=Citrullus colocynthis TaxID=252529 RepID=A0ABP0ZAS7_9ROSI
MQLGSFDGCRRFERPNRVESDGDERSDRNGMLYRWFQFDCCGTHFHLLSLNCRLFRAHSALLPKLMVVYASLFLD